MLQNKISRGPREFLLRLGAIGLGDNSADENVLARQEGRVQHRDGSAGPPAYRERAGQV